MIFEDIPVRGELKIRALLDLKKIEVRENGDGT